MTLEDCREGWFSERERGLRGGLVPCCRRCAGSWCSWGGVLPGLLKPVIAYEPLRRDDKDFNPQSCLLGGLVELANPSPHPPGLWQSLGAGRGRTADPCQGSKVSASRERGAGECPYPRA